MTRNLIIFLIFWVLATVPLRTLAQGHSTPEFADRLPGPTLYLKNTDSLNVRIHIAGQTWKVRGMQMSKPREVSAIPVSGGYSIWARLPGRKKDTLLVDAAGGISYYTSQGRWVGVILAGHDTVKWRISLRKWDINEDGPLKEKKPDYFAVRQMLIADPGAEWVDPHTTYIKESQEMTSCTEQIFVARDKSVVFPGDTLWFSTLVFAPPGAASSTLHVEIYEKNSNTLIDSSKWLLEKGYTRGQLKCPAKGDYWVRMYTSMSDEEYFSLTVRDRAPEYVVYHLGDDTSLPGLVGGLLALESDSIGYYVRKRHSSLQLYSAVVSDTVQPSFLSQTAWRPYNRCMLDTNFLRYDFQVVAKRACQGQLLNVIYTQNGKSRKELFQQIDTTRVIRLDHVAFYGGKSGLDYQLNRGQQEDVTLEPISWRRPWIDVPFCIADTIKQFWVNLPAFAGGKSLDTAVVKPGSRQNLLIAVERRYIEDSLKFGSSARFHYSPMRDFRDSLEGIFDYLNWVQPNAFSTDGTYLDYKHHTPYKLYIDEQESDWNRVCHIPAYQIALFRAIDDQPEGMTTISRLCVYLRKGDDAARVSPTHLKKLPLEGYSIPKKWTTPDRSTLKWIPFTNTDDKIYLGTKPPFRIQIIAIWRSIPCFMSWLVER
jgi:hypothetical protein